MHPYLRLSSLVLGAILLCPALARADETQKQPLANGWVVEIKTQGEELDCFVCDSSRVTLLKNGKQMARQDFGEGKVELVRFADGKYSKDLTATGVDSIILSHFSGGAHCCFDFSIYTLGKTAQKIADVDAADFGDIFPQDVIDLDNNGTFEIQVLDDVFTYWKVSFAESPAPLVVWEYQNGRYRPSAKLMKKAWTDKKALWQQAAELNAALKVLQTKGFDIQQWRTFDLISSDDKHTLPPALWEVMADLLYAGNTELAVAFLDKAWYQGLKGKSLFLKEFKKQLLSSQYSGVVKKLNPGFF